MARPKLDRQRVAVIGAGLAGMAAARELAGGGAEVVVFEKARGPGGRMPTRRHETGAFDHGAQYFTARSEAFRLQVEDWCRRGLAAPWEASIVRLEAGRVSSDSTAESRFVGVPKMSVLARDLGEGIELRCGERVASLDSHGNGWQLASDAGKDLGVFETVVLATPAAQTVPLIPDTLASLAERIASVEVDPCQAVMVSFPSPLDCGFDAAFVEDSPLAWIARNASKPARPQAENWVLHGSPEWSRRELETAPEEVARALLTALSEALSRRILPEPDHLTSHRWLLAKTRTPLGTELCVDAEQGIGVCGDWLTGNRVEDAFLSGRRLGRALSEAC